MLRMASRHLASSSEVAPNYAQREARPARATAHRTGTDGRPGGEDDVWHLGIKGLKAPCRGGQAEGTCDEDTLIWRQPLTYLPAPAIPCLGSDNPLKPR